ncbi:hypothetical protein AVEN_84041-1 [Araneus ventricosus]|uniref:Uncharacterized protein n=1 Tax=Araneus ventricosus TaxID=182803 RepID=A0A4Y2KQM8_ARAVE|nr:hypothetical protein AVEN_84041-1 [Araneus ventricosus]
MILGALSDSEKPYDRWKKNDYPVGEERGLKQSGGEGNQQQLAWKPRGTRAPPPYRQAHIDLLKSQKIVPKNSWEIPLKHRRALYKIVIERVLAHGAVAWCLEPTVRIARKLSTVQRPFLLAISDAYRTSSKAGNTGYPSSSSTTTEKSSWHGTL